jgi:adenylate kinase family enzyme
MKSLFIIGPSGVGKSTLCEALHYNYAEIFGETNVLTINLDCANLESKCKIDINKLITLEDIMEEEAIG